MASLLSFAKSKVTGEPYQGTEPGRRWTCGTFEPRYAIVTASDSGIGKATAVALAERGMDIGITWHTDADGRRGDRGGGAQPRAQGRTSPSWTPPIRRNAGR